MTGTLTFEPDGRAIPFADEGTGPVLMLVPGLGLGIGYLGPLAHSLVAAGHRVVRVGARTGAQAAASLHDAARDVRDVMSHLDVAHAWIGGHAFGGAVARTAARDEPDRVDGVLLLGVEDATQATDDAARPLPDILRTARDTRLADAQLAALAATPDRDWVPLADGVPVLVVQGADDDVTPPEGGIRLQEQAPGLVSLTAVEGGGHLFPATHVGATSWIIEDYLDWD